MGKAVGNSILSPTEGRLQNELSLWLDITKYSLKIHHKTQFHKPPNFFSFVVHRRT